MHACRRVVFLREGGSGLSAVNDARSCGASNDAICAWQEHDGWQRALQSQGSAVLCTKVQRERPRGRGATGLEACTTTHLGRDMVIAVGIDQVEELALVHLPRRPTGHFFA